MRFLELSLSVPPGANREPGDEHNPDLTPSGVSKTMLAGLAETAGKGLTNAMRSRLEAQGVSVPPRLDAQFDAAAASTEEGTTAPKSASQKKRERKKAAAVRKKAEEVPEDRPPDPPPVTKPVAKPVAVSAATSLRFPIGTRVECCMGENWRVGTVIAHWYTQKSFSEGMSAPYQIELDTGERIYAPRDESACIRASAAPKPTRSGPNRRGTAGGIDQLMMPIPKAHAYVDLMLAPSGEAEMTGEEAMMTAALGEDGDDGALMGCSSDDLEVTSAIMAFTRIGPTAVRGAMLARAPESLAQLCAFIAHTPQLSATPRHVREKRGWPNASDGWRFEGDLKEPMSYAPEDNRVSLCEFTSRNANGRGAPFHCKETALALSPPQKEQCYCTVMAASLQLLITLCDCDPNERGAAHAMRQLQASPAFVPMVQRLMELVARWGEPGPLSAGEMPDFLDCGRPLFQTVAVSPGSGGLPRAALWALTRLLCASPQAPRARWLLRGHRAHDRRYAPMGSRKEKKGARDYWQPLPPAADGVALQGFAGLLSRATRGTLPLPGRNAACVEEVRQQLRVLAAVAQGQHCDDLVDGDGHPVLPPLPPVQEDPEEVVAAFDAVSDGQPDHEKLTDELAACADEEERLRATLFFLDARLLPPGRSVTVHGLVSKPELNGAAAVVDGPRPAGSVRFPVRPLTGSEGAPVLMRPGNLRLVSRDEMDSEE